MDTKNGFSVFAEETYSPRKTLGWAALAVFVLIFGFIGSKAIQRTRADAELLKENHVRARGVRAIIMEWKAGQEQREIDVRNFQASLEGQAALQRAIDRAVALQRAIDRAAASRKKIQTTP